MLLKFTQKPFRIQALFLLFLLSFLPSTAKSVDIPAKSTDTPLAPPADPNNVPKKEDLLIKAAELEREADTKQTTDLIAANELRTAAKELRNQADKIK